MRSDPDLWMRRKAAELVRRMTLANGYELPTFDP